MTGLQVTLETVTPLFLAGADPRGAPELRAASVRGALRFWLRALLGGVIGDAPDRFDDLRKAESAVFGSTDIGASPVVVRVGHASLQTQTFSELSANRMGVSYLYFTARATKQEAERRAIKAGSSFELSLDIRPGLRAAGDTALRQAHAALWLLTYLGGLGARSRRAGGSLQVIQASGEPSDLPTLIVRATTPDELRAELAGGLKRLRQLVSSSSPVSINNPSTFDILHPRVCKVWVVNKLFPSWQQLLNQFGEFLMNFRRRRAAMEFPALVEAADGRTRQLPVVQRAILGLPIVFYDPAARRSIGTLEGMEHDRRASPFLMHVTRIGNPYVLVLSWFRGCLLPDHERLALKESSARKRTLAEGQPPDWHWLENELLPELGQQVGELKEVTGW
jgi:CRISPR-associated protein Cmr1